MMEFNERLRGLRHHAGMTQQQVADALTIQRATYAYYESGRTFPDLETVMRIAQFFGVSTEYLLHDYREENPVPILCDPTRPSYTVAEAEWTADMWELREPEQVLLAAFRRLNTAEQEKTVDDLLKKVAALPPEAIPTPSPSDDEPRDGGEDSADPAADG